MPCGHHKTPTSTGGAEGHVKVGNQPEDIGAGLGVEVAGRLVRQENRRVHGEGAGDGDTLALATRQLIG